MQACKTASSEIHNQRQKTLSYVREDLSPLNSYKVLESISDCDQRIRATYQQVVGQKMQPSATPIEEAVIVVDKDATLEQLVHFGELCREHLGITPIQYYLHLDEGHYDAKTREWKPNYHGHIIFDTTCHEHVMVQRQMKKNGKPQKGPDGKPLMHEVDNFGKILRLTPADMSRMQDFAAEATGLKRGVSSDAVHLDAQRFKAEAIAQQTRRLEAQSAELRKEVSASKVQLRSIGVFRSIANMVKTGSERIAAAIGISPKITRLENTVKEQAGIIQSTTTENEQLKSSLQQEIQRRMELQADSNHYRYRANAAEESNSRNNYALSRIASILTSFKAETVEFFERKGFPEIIGQNRWNHAKQEALDREQGITHSRGIRR